jgi:hypothetical protein
VRLIGFFNPVLTVIAFGWQELRNLINALRAPPTEGSGHKAHRLTDFEFMPVHEALHHVQRLCSHLVGGTKQLQLSASWEVLYHEIARWGAGFYFVVKWRFPS